nr:SidA/IucD/PvdA family monooxygenase [Kibdelosporangium sp. MJ126-NF4]CEL12858.1 Siderophore biosynthesis protein, monooxygenase [Kibdelosporangium sp. MJ126-NF4]CTQ98544.1 Siderophore biosynthesis protein, monooxygenase [Kibdelosporangium sp. MJ126-NF4]
MTDIHDLVGVGFGPSNLALSIAAAEADVPLRAVFLERSERFGWHRDMLIDDATMQVAFLKDLATPRNPVSRFGFVPYLWARDRLSAFINQKTLFPTRVEFHDYLEWAAAQVDDVVEYAAEVVDIRPVHDNGEVAFLDVVSVRPDGQARVRRTRNVVLALGLQPVVPPGVHPSPRVWHSADLLGRAATLDRAKPLRFAVVGAGQSAAECVSYLHRAFEQAEVHAVFGRYGYSPADDSPFANRIFDPAAVDDYFVSPDQVKQRFFDYHANTNYSAVDTELLEELSHRVYRESLSGRQRLFTHHLSAITDLADTDDGVSVSVEFLPTGERTMLRVDHVIHATGYRPTDPIPLLGTTAELCHKDTLGRLRVERDYRVVTKPDVRTGIYLQGGTEHSHGISSSLLSNVAVRAGEILASIQERPQRRDGDQDERTARAGDDPARRAAALPRR